MKNSKINWLKELKRKKQIVEFDINGQKYHRLSSPSRFYIADDRIAYLKNQYNPGIEKGGLFLFSQTKQKNELNLRLEEIVFVKNISPLPSEWYEADPIELKVQTILALDKQLIPCIFHSHPTKAGNVLLESFEYNFQSNTSDPDKIASALTYFAGGLNLRLPEFLIVCNGSLKSGIFIGIYGGLIAPLDFSKRKNELVEQFFENAVEGAANFFNTPERKLLGVLGGASLILLGAKYPKAILPVLTTTAAVMPSIVYSTPSITNYFAMTHGLSVDIRLPKYEDSQVMDDEKKIITLRETLKRRSSFSKVA